MIGLGELGGLKGSGVRESEFKGLGFTVWFRI